jgi:hypothetical protein
MAHRVQSLYNLGFLYSSFNGGITSTFQSEVESACLTVYSCSRDVHIKLWNGLCVFTYNNITFKRQNETWINEIVLEMRSTSSCIHTVASVISNTISTL